MSHYAFSFQGQTLHALASGTLFWPEQSLLCVSDLHFGKAQRYARQGGGALPPYETQDTLLRLEADITATGAHTLVCLGDSFDTSRASNELDSVEKDWLLRLQAGRRWIWIEGNHDPGPIDLGGAHMAEFSVAPLVFRHIAEPQASGEISGHFHPKALVQTKSRRISSPCFVIDEQRIVMPAFGTYTGGMDVRQPEVSQLFEHDAICVLIGKRAIPVPLAAL